MTENSKSIVLGGGCFWCTEASFSLLDGVIRVTPGYAGGSTANPTYEQVCTGTTGHAEVVKIEYDPDRVSLERLLEAFFVMHDPTSVNRQGDDIGTQYRSIILYATDEEKAVIDQYLAKVRKDYAKPLATDVRKLSTFYTAEAYHHRYFEQHPTESYCRLVIAPKVKKMQKTYR